MHVELCARVRNYLKESVDLVAGRGANIDNYIDFLEILRYTFFTTPRLVYSAPILEVATAAYPWGDCTMTKSVRPPLPHGDVKARNKRKSKYLDIRSIMQMDRDEDGGDLISLMPRDEPRELRLSDLRMDTNW